jgi:hypothetical protein
MLRSLRTSPHLFPGKSVTKDINEENGSSDRKLQNSIIQRYIVPLVGDVKKCPEGGSLLRSNNNYYTQANAVRNGGRIVLTPETLTGVGSGYDFALINPNYRGKKYRFMYTVAGYISTGISPLGYGIGKIDVDTKEMVAIWPGTKGQVPSEPVFIPKPSNEQGNEGDEAEDDGILLTIVRPEVSYDVDNYLVAVDPKSMKELGRAYLKSDVAGWYHAIFVKSLK